jgi:hypothetical protein
MMHMFKNLSTVKDYNHSEVDGDARNRMKRHRKLREDNFGISYGDDGVQAPQSARCKSSNPPQCRASRPYASVFDPSTERSETITSRSSLRQTLLSHA